MIYALDSVKTKRKMWLEAQTRMNLVETNDLERVARKKERSEIELERRLETSKVKVVMMTLKKQKKQEFQINKEGREDEN